MDKNKLKILIGFIAIILFFAVIIISISVIENKNKNTTTESTIQTVTVDDVTYRYKRNLETFLLIGLDDFGEQTKSDAYYNTEQADFILLFVFDKDEKTVSALQINRDTMTNNQVLGIGAKRAGTAYEQIALSHTYGSGDKVSCQNVVESVTNLLGLSVVIDHYASITMDAVPLVNDAIGGVTVKIDDDLTILDPAFVKGATVTLKGDQSLSFVRARQEVTDGTNLMRMSRQKTYMNAFIEQAKAKETDESITSYIDELSEYLVSDCSVERLDSLYDMALEYEFKGITYLEGEAKTGTKYVEYYVDEDAKTETVLSIFYEKVD